MLFDECNSIDKSTPVPLYFQLKEMIIREIKSGSYPVGSMIPAETDICKHFDLSRTTVRQAIIELVNEGWLNRKKSKGTFVSRPSLNQDFIQRLETYSEQIRRLGMVPRTEVLDMQVTNADETVADKLQVSVGEKVIYLLRRRFADDMPIVVVRTYLPYQECKFILERDMNRESLYDTLSASEETQVWTSHRIVQAIEADAETSRLLDIKKGKPVHFFESISSNVFGKRIEFSQARYRGDKNKFEVTVYI